MPTPPHYDREEWARELNEELPALIASLQRDLEATPGDATEKREGLTWRIKRAERRMADLRERLLRDERRL